MHELSIAMSLAELVADQLAGEPDAVVTAVDIRIGRLASVVPAALEFAWGPVTQSSRLHASELRIQWQEDSDVLELVAIELADP
jgi:hydrogenase nickel incorporation protein HypA/HybF